LPQSLSIFLCQSAETLISSAVAIGDRRGIGLALARVTAKLRT
jgi:hypothetical protein